MHTPHAWMPCLLAGALSAGCVTEDVVGRIVEESPGERPTDNSTNAPDESVEDSTSEPSDESVDDSTNDPTDEPADSSLSPVACTGVVCADFETPLTNDAVSNSEQATVERNCTLSHEGACALHVSLLEGAGRATWRSAFTPLREEVYVRLWLWVPDAEGSNNIEDIAILHVGEAGTDTGFNLDLRSAGRFELFLVEDQTTVLSEMETWVPGRWSCLQLSVTQNGEGSTLQLYVDEALAASATTSILFTSGAANLLTAGVDWSAQNQQPFEFWLDALVLDDAPIPCSDVR